MTKTAAPKKKRRMIVHSDGSDDSDEDVKQVSSAAATKTVAKVPINPVEASLKSGDLQKLATGISIELDTLSSQIQELYQQFSDFFKRNPEAVKRELARKYASE